MNKELKARAHALDAVVMIGGKGLTDGVNREIDIALDAHELIKIKIGGEDRAARRTLAEAICERHQAELIQAIGKVIVIYRANKKKQKR